MSIAGMKLCDLKALGNYEGTAVFGDNSGIKGYNQTNIQKGAKRIRHNISDSRYQADH